MPAHTGRPFVRRRIGRAGIVRRVPEFAREKTFEAIVEAGKAARKEYRTFLRKNHKITGLLHRAVRMKRSKRYNLVRVGLFSKERGQYEDERGVTPPQKATWLEFGTNRTEVAGEQKPRPILLPIYRKVSKRIPQHIRDLWNREVELVLGREVRGVHLAALRRGLRL